MEKANKEIREAIKKKRLFYYEVANELKIGKTYFSGILRHELPAERKEKILEVIKNMSI